MRPVVLLLLLLAACAAGCSEAFDPFVEMEEGFALFGFLDARRDTQFVRVQTLADRDAEPQRGDARLTSTNLGTGTERVWQDSLVALDDGRVGLLLFARFRPEAGAVYRLEVTGAGGTLQTVDVPMPVEPTLTPATPSNIGGLVSQRLNLASEARPGAVLVVYTVRRVGGAAQNVIVMNVAEPVSGGGFDVRVGLELDALVVRGTLGAGPEEPVELLGLRLRYEIVDPERVVVADGLGMIGVAASFEAGWTLAREFVEALGFLDRQGGAGGGGQSVTGGG